MPALVVSIVAFVLAFVGSMPLAGPVSVMVVSRAAERRHRDAIMLGLGAAVPEGVYAAIAFFGFATFLARHALVLPISHGVTAVVLAIVGVHFLRWKPKERRDQPTSERAPFVLGLTISAMNPTLLATWSAVTTALYSRRLVEMTGLLTIPFGVSAAAGVAAWNLLLVAVLKRWQNHFPDRLVKGVIRGMGLLLVGVAVWSAVDLVRHLTR